MPSASGFTDGTGAGQPEPQHLVGVGMRCMMQVNFPRHEQSSGAFMFLLSLSARGRPPAALQYHACVTLAAAAAALRVRAGTGVRSGSLHRQLAPHPGRRAPSPRSSGRSGGDGGGGLVCPAPGCANRAALRPA